MDRATPVYSLAVETSGILLLSVASFAAGVMNAMAGGGSILTAPLLLILGLPPAVALATNRTAMTALSVAGLIRYHRDGKVPWRTALGPALVAGVGAVTGSLVMVDVAPEHLRRIVAITMVIVTTLVLLKSAPVAKPGHEADKRPGTATILVSFIAVFLLGFYGGFYGAGVSLLFVLLFVHRHHLGYVEAAAATQVVVGLASFAAAVVYIYEGVVDARIAIIMTVTLAGGGYCGAHLAVKGGDRLVRGALAVIAFAMAVELLRR